MEQEETWKQKKAEKGERVYFEVETDHLRDLFGENEELPWSVELHHDKMILSDKFLEVSFWKLIQLSLFSLKDVSEEESKQSQ